MTKSFQDVMQILSYISIPIIDADTQFWLIRTNGGKFYNEFINNEFVALGWNRITKATTFSRSTIDSLKEEIKRLYNENRPGNAINKCNRFINEVHEGDYALIPNEGGTEFAICKLGNYYEVETYDYEYEMDKLFENTVEYYECPYCKRRKIEVLLTVSSKRLGLKLQKATSSYHGISNLNLYAEEILNCIYNCYEFRGDLYYTINISKKDKIRVRELSQLMYSLTELFCEAVNDEDSISVITNINSPGKIVITLRKIYEIIKKKAPLILIVYFMVLGGSIGGLEFEGGASKVIDLIKEYKTMNIEIEQAEEELEGMRLENYQKLVDLIVACKENEIDIEKIDKNIEIIRELDSSLKFQSNQEFAHEKDDDAANNTEKDNDSNQEMTK